ncbi:MAG: SEC-C metal-binding domain-containing protein [Polyangiaceae bacterium]
MHRQFPTASASQFDSSLRVAGSLLELYPQAQQEALSETTLSALAAAALELAAALAGDAATFAQLDRRFPGARLAERLLELPAQLADAKQTESALQLARALSFVAPDLVRGDEALILANAGRREEALALVASNLAQARDIPTAEAKAGDVYRALGEPDAAEAYYRRSLAESRTALERSEAVLRIVSLLSDNGREQDAADFLSLERLKQERERQAERPVPSSPAASAALQSVPKVGRNEPCPCGSGKKYKKCHGADA